MIKDALSQRQATGDDLDLLESATVGSSSTVSAGGLLPRSGGTGLGSGLLPSNKSFEMGSRKSTTAGAGLGGTIVKAEFSDMFLRQDQLEGDNNSSSNLAKVSASCECLCVWDICSNYSVSVGILFVRRLRRWQRRSDCRSFRVRRSSLPCSSSRHSSSPLQPL